MKGETFLDEVYVLQGNCPKLNQDAAANSKMRNMRKQ